MILGLTLATILSSAEAGDAVSLERNAALDAALKEAVRRDRQERRATFWTQLPLGAVLLPAGILLSSRADPEAHLLGVGFIVGGSLQLATAPLLLIPSSLERVGRANDAAAEAGTPGRLQATEAAWEQAAASKRAGRPYVGAIYMGLGVASLATGLVILLANPGFAGLSHDAQYAWGAGLVGGGVPFATIGLRALLQPTPEETSWDAYHRSWSTALVPLPGGASAAIRGTF